MIDVLPAHIVRKLEWGISKKSARVVCLFVSLTGCQPLRLLSPRDPADGAHLLTLLEMESAHRETLEKVPEPEILDPRNISGLWIWQKNYGQILPPY